MIDSFHSIDCVVMVRYSFSMGSLLLFLWPLYFSLPQCVLASGNFAHVGTGLTYMGTGTRSAERVRRQGVVPTYSPRRHVSVPTGAASSLGENARGYRERFLDGGRRELGRNAMTNGAFGDNAVGRTYWVRGDTLTCTIFPS